jgi:tRNA dimethylallyltransferase
MDRELLYQRINDRVDQMIQKGLLEEVRQLASFREHVALKTVGYKELFSYLDGEISLNEAICQIKNNTRKYARKQLTWFRKNNLYTWFHPDHVNDMIRFIESEIN